MPIDVARADMAGWQGAEQRKGSKRAERRKGARRGSRARDVWTAGGARAADWTGVAMTRGNNAQEALSARRGGGVRG